MLKFFFIVEFHWLPSQYVSVIIHWFGFREYWSQRRLWNFKMWGICEFNNSERDIHLSSRLRITSIKGLFVFGTWSYLSKVSSSVMQTDSGLIFVACRGESGEERDGKDHNLISRFRVNKWHACRGWCMRAKSLRIMRIYRYRLHTQSSMHVPTRHPPAPPWITLRCPIRRSIGTANWCVRPHRRCKSAAGDRIGMSARDAAFQKRGAIKNETPSGHS